MTPGLFSFDFLQNFADEMDPAHMPFGPWPGSAPRRSHQSDNPVDFVPRADVFNTPTEYVVHASLPGAKKADVSVDYDSEESTLRLSGVIHRPEFSEELHRAMVSEERASEIGVFERNIPLGTHGRPASVDVEHISAKFVDGVLVVRLPKTQSDPAQTQKKIYIDNDGNLDSDDEVAQSLNEKHASVQEIQDETDTMHVDTETETGDLLTEAEEHSYTPSHDSEEEELYDMVKSKDTIKDSIN